MHQSAIKIIEPHEKVLEQLKKGAISVLQLSEKPGMKGDHIRWLIHDLRKVGEPIITIYEERTFYYELK